MDVKAVRAKSQWITMCSSLRIITIVTMDYNVLESSNDIVVFILFSIRNMNKLHCIQSYSIDTVAHQESHTLREAANAISVVQLCNR